MRRDLLENIVEEVVKRLKLPEGSSTDLLEALSSIGKLEKEERSFGKKLLYWRYRSPEWIIRAALQARKLWMEKKREESVEIASLALYFAAEHLLTNKIAIAECSEISSLEKCLGKALDEEIEKGKNEFKLSLQFIESYIAESMKKSRNPNENVLKLIKLTTVLLLTVFSEPPSELVSMIRECRKQKELVEKSDRFKRLSLEVRVLSGGFVFLLFALFYFSTAIGIISLLVGTVSIGFLLRRMENFLKSELVSKKKECSLYQESAANFLLYP
ncbi:MAG: hypothetical protein QXD85_01465 [Fervidicoccaceae archaeon]